MAERPAGEAKRSVNPHFLVVQIPAETDAGGYLTKASRLVPGHGGEVLAAAPSADVECLEPGTPAASILLARFDDEKALDAFWDDTAHTGALADVEDAPGLLALAAPGLPYAGLPEAPDVPTVASVTAPAGRGPVAYMIVQGSSKDQARMDEYRDIILPMIAALGAFYAAFDIEGNVRTIRGEWPWDIFAISRWPDHAAGHEFWDSERYQKVAVPQRTGAGEFWVHFFTGRAG